MKVINKIAQVLGWLVILFFVLGVFEVGVFKISYQSSSLGSFQFQTSNISVIRGTQKLIYELKHI